MPLLPTNVLRSVLTLDAQPYMAGLRASEDATDRFIKSVNRANAATARRTRFAGAVGGDQAAASFSEKMERAASLSNALQTAQRGAAVGAVALAAGLGKAVQAAGRMEQVRIAFRTLFGGAQQAEEMLRKLQAFDAESPFDFEQSVKGAQRLKAMGFAAQDIIPTMTAAGNAVAAVGGTDETFDRVLLALGQIRTKGKASAEEINQLAEAGVPAYEILQQKLGLTKDQLGNLGAAGIDAGRALAALQEGFNERFGGAMIAQSKTLEGRLSTLRSEFFKLGDALGGPLLGPLTDLVKGLTDAVGWFNSLPKPIKDTVAWIAVFVTAGLGAAVVALKLVGLWTDAYIKKLVVEAALHQQAAKAALQHAAANTAVAKSAQGGGLPGLPGGKGGFDPNARIPPGQWPGGKGGAGAPAPKAPGGGTMGKVGAAIGAVGSVANPAVFFTMLNMEWGKMVEGGLKWIGVSKDWAKVVGNIVSPANFAIGSVGDLWNAFMGGGKKAPAPAAPAAPAAPPVPKTYADFVNQAILDQLKQQTELLKAAKGGQFPFDTKDVPGGEQLGLIGLGHAIA